MSKKPGEGTPVLGHLDERTRMKTFNLFNGETEKEADEPEAVLIAESAFMADTHVAIGLVAGVVAVQGLNIIRIISLFYLGQWNREVFEWAHLYVWQALIMLDVLVVSLDALASLAEVARSLNAIQGRKQPGARVFHLGPERDRPIFADLDVVLVDEDAAELVVCTGLFDDEAETPVHYAELLERLAAVPAGASGRRATKPSPTSSVPKTSRPTTRSCRPTSSTTTSRTRSRRTAPPTFGRCRRSRPGRS